jgi:hypothetical protein
MTKRSLADLKAAFENKSSGDGNQDWKKFFPFWKAPVDSVSTVRFLPDADADNPMGFVVENLVHELNVNGKREKVACLKMYGESCPICELSSRYYDEKSPMYNEELGKKFYRKKSYIAQCLVIESPVEHNADELVKLIEFGPQVFKQMQAAFGSGDLEEVPYELKGGYNFRFRKTLTGSGQNSYTTSSFAPKQTDVSDQVIEKMNLFRLADHRSAKVERAAMEALLVAAQTGAAMESAMAGAAGAAPAAGNGGDAAAPAVSTPASAGGLSVVEQLRARAAAAKAAAADAEA